MWGVTGEGEKLRVAGAAGKRGVAAWMNYNSSSLAAAALSLLGASTCEASFLAQCWHQGEMIAISYSQSLVVLGGEVVHPGNREWDG